MHFLLTRALPMLQHTALLLRLPSSITPALDDFRVSWQPAQSESEYVVLLLRPFFSLLNMCPYYLSRFKYLTTLFNLARLCRVEFDIF